MAWLMEGLAATVAAILGQGLNSLLIGAIAFILRGSMNEPPPPSGAKLCPICRAKIPFSLALHMQAAHSPEALERNAEAVERELSESPGSAHQPPRSKRPSGAKRGNHPRRGQGGFGRKKGKRKH